MVSLSIERTSGILLHVSSLPNKYGIGTFGKEAYEFVDFLKKSGQRIWQILPLNPVAEGNSPYSTYSAFALNPYFIDLDLLTEDGLLQENQYTNLDFGSDPARVDYDKIHDNKMRMLRHVYENSKGKQLEGYDFFVENNKEWLFPYAEFMSFRRYLNTSLQNWNTEVKGKLAHAMENYHSLIGQDEFDFWTFVQYISNKQWMNLKKYVNDNEIRIFGDMPIYVSGDSADVWANPEVFDVDADLNPQHVAGCPPDDFAPDGQRWGMPVFNWNYLERTGYDWWIKRIERNVTLFDVIRIDHFRGLESFYSIPIDEDTAINGEWVKAKGKIFFDEIKNRFGNIEIVLEDLGFITNDVIDLRTYTGYPGMKVFQFANFNDSHHPYLPSNCEINSVIYTSTHDNDTLLGWLNNLNDDEKRLVQSYLNTYEEYNMTWNCIEKVMSSKSKLSIIQMQDFLELGSEARMNIPGIAYGNWEWRVSKDVLISDLSEKINHMTKKYNRS